MKRFLVWPANTSSTFSVKSEVRGYIRFASFLVSLFPQPTTQQHLDGIDATLIEGGRSREVHQKTERE
jgi:hypothetical protein